MKRERKRERLQLLCTTFLVGLFFCFGVDDHDDARLYIIRNCSDVVSNDSSPSIKLAVCYWKSCVKKEKHKMLFYILIFFSFL